MTKPRGGEGQSPISRKRPTTPWGYAALGRRCRKIKKYKDYISILPKTL